VKLGDETEGRNANAKQSSLGDFRDTGEPGALIEIEGLARGFTPAVLRDVPVGEPLTADLGAALDAARLMAAAEIAGLAHRLFNDTLAYIKTREQFNQPIGRFQVIQHRMVDAYAKVESIQSALYRAVLQPAAPMAAIKAHVAEQAIWVAHQAVQLHGGMGMSDDLAIGHGLKRIVLLSKLFGDPAGDILDYARAA
jgi:alkylation response protein AidB-like acyl-CoA dehydrogenase